MTVKYGLRCGVNSSANREHRLFQDILDRFLQEKQPSASRLDFTLRLLDIAGA